MHNKLLDFFTNIKEGCYFDEVESACSKWWTDNGSTVGYSKKVMAKEPAASEANVSVPDFSRLARNMTSI